MQPDEPRGMASGFVCPRCGGTLWERPGSDGHSAETAEARTLQFDCRIGHRFQAAQLWIEHCAERNRAVQSAARALAENAALARRLATWTREQGNLAAAAELERAAAEEGQLFEQVLRMVDGLPEPGRGAST